MSSNSKTPANTAKGDPALLSAAANPVAFPGDEWKSPSLFLAAAAARSAATTRKVTTTATPYSFPSLQSPPLRFRWNTPSPWHAYIPCDTLPPLSDRAAPILFSPVTQSTMDTVSGAIAPKNPPNERGAENVPPYDNGGKIPPSDPASDSKKLQAPESIVTENKASEPKPSPQKYIRSFTASDVICGRGRKPRPANQELDLLVKLHAPEFASAIKTQKPLVVHKIVQAIKSKGGRFLQTCNGSYVVMSDVGKIYKKVSEALGRQIAKSKPPPSTLASDPNKLIPPVSVTVPPRSVQSPESSATKVPIIHDNTAQTFASATEKSHGKSQSASSNPPKRPAVLTNGQPNSKRQNKKPSNGIKSKVGNAPVANAAKPQNSNAEPRPQGVRAAVTKTGKYEARYKHLGTDKKHYPKYIATVNDRETALWLGNFVARCVQTAGMAFEAAKEEALARLKTNKFTDATLPQDDILDLMKDVVSTLISQDKKEEEAAVASSSYPPDGGEVDDDAVDCDKVAAV